MEEQFSIMRRQRLCHVRPITRAEPGIAAALL
jgi:hypothetical protein